jgi:hypothetical protein
MRRCLLASLLARWTRRSQAEQSAASSAQQSTAAGSLPHTSQFTRMVPSPEKDRETIASVNRYELITNARGREEKEAQAGWVRKWERRRHGEMGGGHNKTLEASGVGLNYRLYNEKGPSAVVKLLRDHKVSNFIQ